MSTTTRRRLGMIACVLVLLLGSALTSTTPAAWAEPGQLTPVPQFGDNPGGLAMFEWIPADLPANAPVVVVLHGCFATAALYDDETGWPALAERWKVALIFPAQVAANEPTNCFRFWDPADNTRGNGEAASIKQMIDRTLEVHGGDPHRVFVMGHSGGGLFTSVLLATYPDVFAAGAIVAGGPYGCGDEGAIALGPDGDKSPVRGGECVDGSVDRTPQQWGDLVRQAVPGYTGAMPRVSIWHGTGDTMVSPKNLAEIMEQWTDVHGIDQIPDVTNEVRGYPHAVFTDGKGNALVETYSLTDQSHGWPYDPGTESDQCDGRAPSWDAGICGAYYAGVWFGLDQQQACVPPSDRSPKDKCRPKARPAPASAPASR